jgi:hypothetical protein
MIHVDQFGRKFYCTKPAVVFHTGRNGIIYASCEDHSSDPRRMDIRTKNEYITYQIMTQ